MLPPKCQWPTGYWCRSGGPGPPPPRRKEETRDGSGDLRAGLQRPAGEGRDDRLPARRPARARRASRLDVPEEWVFADEGHSGATLVRPGLEALRDLAAQGCLDVVLVYSPDRLARKFAYQALLIEELARCGVRVEFVKGPRGDSPEDQLLVQFQGMFAEYEKAQLMERYRRGKAWRAKTGSVNVLGGAPFGYRYVRKTPECGARYEVVPHEAALVAEMFRRYADDGASIADLRRWLTEPGGAHPHRQGTLGPVGDLGHAPQPRLRRHRGLRQDPDRPRAARAEPHRPPGRAHRAAGSQDAWTGRGRNGPASRSPPSSTRRRSTGSSSGWPTTSGSPPGTPRSRPCCRAWPPARPAATATTAPPRPRPPGRRSTTTAASAPTTTATRADASAQNKPVRADYADQVVWDHVTALLADPALIRAEIGKRLERARTSDPVTRKRGQLEQALAKTARRSAAMITAFSEQLITIDELRARMPALRARETGLKDQIAALDAQAADRDAYLRLAGDLEGFLARLRGRLGHRHHRGPPARPARRRPGRPHRTREDHHPPPHPRPGTIQRRRPPRHHRHGG